MPRNVQPKLEVSTIVDSNGRLAFVAGSAPVKNTPTALRTLPIRYHPLRVSVVSVIGAHRNFHVWGRSDSATRVAICATLMPACDKTYATATDRDPPSAPNGTMRNMNTLGWVWRSGLMTGPSIADDSRRAVRLPRTSGARDARRGVPSGARARRSRAPAGPAGSPG